jgi:hypothetical protein
MDQSRGFRKLMMSGHPLVNHAEVDHAMYSTSGYCAQTFDQVEQRRQLDFVRYLEPPCKRWRIVAAVRYSGRIRRPVFRSFGRIAPADAARLAAGYGIS